MIQYVSWRIIFYFLFSCNVLKRRRRTEERSEERKHRDLLLLIQEEMVLVMVNLICAWVTRTEQSRHHHSSQLTHSRTITSVLSLWWRRHKKQTHLAFCILSSKHLTPRHRSRFSSEARILTLATPLLPCPNADYFHQGIVAVTRNCYLKMYFLTRTEEVVRQRATTKHLPLLLFVSMY